MTSPNENSRRAGYAKLLEAWERPAHAGEPIGCVATSFTFVPDFFENECLGRFLGLESVPEDGAAYFVEREEQLAQLACCAALVDQHHVAGSRNLRWDLLSARLPQGILHAKISVLLWSRQARLIVASANLTPDGYRRNHEVFGVLDYVPEGSAPLSVLHEVLDFLGDAVKYASSSSAEKFPPGSRWLAFLDRIRKATREWGDRSARTGAGKPRIMPVLNGPGRPSVFQQLKVNWPEPAAPTRAYVLSPFFDPPEAANKPAREIWNLFRGRGPKSVSYEVVAELETDQPRAQLVLHAPASLANSAPHDSDCEVKFQALQLEENRPLHAKSLWLESRNWTAYLIGSSNFTSPGLGLGKVSNLEANLVYLVNHSTNRRALRELDRVWLDGKPLHRDYRFAEDELPDAGQDSPAPDALTLPRFFGDATYAKGVDNQFVLELNFADAPPPGWMILHESREDTLFSERAWIQGGRKKLHQIPWNDPRPPSALRIRWRGLPLPVWWPVNVRDAKALPPPEVLRELSLDELVAILTSAGSLHQVMKRLLQQKQARTINQADVMDPHRRVDTSQFLIQRTRRVTWALNAIRERLEQPASSPETLHWRLHGPVGVLKFAEAIEREAQTPSERCFLLAELGLTLGRVQPKPSPHCLTRKEIRTALHAVIRELQVRAGKSMSRHDPIRRYARRAFKEARA